MNWYKISEYSNINIISYNTYGDLAVDIKGKIYKYKNVNEYEYEALKKCITIKNKKAGLKKFFNILKTLEKNESYTPKVNDIKKEDIQLKLFSEKEENMTKLSEKEKILYILRSPSGVGKSTLAKKLKGDTGKIFETDSYFMEGNVYKFDPKKLKQYHKQTLEDAISAMNQSVSPIIIANTNTLLKEAKAYVKEGIAHGYKIVIEEPNWDERLKNKNGTWNKDFIKQLQKNTDRIQEGKSLPEEVIDRQVNRYEYRLPNETDQEIVKRIMDGPDF